MMMMTLESVKTGLLNSLTQYKNVKIADAILADKPALQNTVDKNSNTENAYRYAATKLKVIEQKKQQYDILEEMMKEMQRTGDVSAKTLETEAGIKEQANTPNNDDGAPAVTQNYAKVAKSVGGVDKLIDAKDISADTKKKLAGEFLAKMQEYKKIENDSAIPQNLSTGDITETQVLKNYAEQKKVYIEALKEAKKKGIIEFTEGKTAEAALENIKLNEKFDPEFKVASGETGLGVDADKNTKAGRLLALRNQLDETRTKAKAAGIDDLDGVLDETTGDAPLPTSTSRGKVRYTFDKEKFKKAFGSEDATKKSLLPAALLIQKELATLKAKDGSSKGLTLDAFDTLLGNATFTDNIEAIYNVSGKPKVTKSSILNTESGIGPILIDKDGKVLNAPADVSKEIEGASDANRETALKEIKPIPINTVRDFSGRSVAKIKLADGKPFDVMVNGNYDVVKNSKKETAIINFRGMPGVLLERDGNYFVRFYDRQKAGTGSVITTGIAQVDPELVFYDKNRKKPKTNIDTSMIKTDSEKRTVIDYYIRPYDKDKKTDDNKVLYVARNFSDNIDRLKAIRAAQYFARMEADPVNFPKKGKVIKPTAQEDTSLTVAGEENNELSTTPISFSKNGSRVLTN
ncbi:MAG: hypothetical protein H2174_10450 [Vampirovibrio sp.]|nr:hypothetical protein [Vampirovibrio sp.]